MNPANSIAKRLFDLLVSVPLLVVAAPLIGLFALLIWFEDSAGSPFFIQERVGYQGKTFHLVKLRSMVVHSVDLTQQTQLDDPRVTRVGRLIRRFKIDELPQILHVVTGKMSLVGPRPTVRSQVDGYTPYQHRRLETRPGLTGWSQVNGNVKIPWEQRIELDIWYVDHWSFWLDLRILLMTVRVVLFGEKVREVKS